MDPSREQSIRSAVEHCVSNLLEAQAASGAPAGRGAARHLGPGPGADERRRRLRHHGARDADRRDLRPLDRESPAAEPANDAEFDALRARVTERLEARKRRHLAIAPLSAAPAEDAHAAIKARHRRAGGG
jgi:hypothetical protein